ncbi:hypothetical protein G6M89_14395 [Natronolimnobius sp. AArcel1]|uniref:hypothetical protein n=1 Tax=Natronolimnobius sp. AArcel1 TaxID=1679093 RepID=UPI0013EDE494|nr:hypothetical protein [Natronolimnobius sp. AArcel1]NGM70184.1 hypothetical protein [Natronolimnobius sp. AArcel1]
MSVADGMDAKKACSFVPAASLEAHRPSLTSISTTAVVSYQSYNCPLESGNKT